MKKKEEINLFIFRRDLRYEDNHAFIELLENSANDERTIKVLPVFIFNPIQIDPHKNQYFSRNAVEFMIQCLKELSMSLFDSLCYFEGDDINILNKLLSYFQINTIAFNTDYTPFAKYRDDRIREWCQEKGISLITSNTDYTLLPFGNILSNSTKAPYEVFTPYYNKFLSKGLKLIPRPFLFKIKKDTLFLNGRTVLRTIAVRDIDKYYQIGNINLAVTGGRKIALDKLKSIEQGRFRNYSKERDFPSLEATTKLSAFMKFGCVSVREVFFASIRNKNLIRELIWREFYANITYYHSHVLSGQIPGKNRNHSFKSKYDNLVYGYDEKYWKAFIEGKTGFPFVDAGIRQLLTTGFCHNRLRMQLGMFFTKDLLMDWKLFEKWMASNLVDYDPSSNNGGCQWTSSTGTDAAPYFRIFNPFSQSKKYDPNADYIRKWVPELRNVPIKSIQAWDQEYMNFPKVNYPRPIVNHSEQVKKALEMFKRI